MFPTLAALLLMASVATASDQAPPRNTPTRIIATAPNNAEIICDLGAENLLVGVSPYANHPPSLKRLPKIGGIQDPDLEQILALRPDLLILRGQFPQVENMCGQYGIAVYHDRTDTLQSLYRTIADLGDLLHRQTEADRLIHTIRDKLDAIRSATADQSRPRVLLTLRSPDRLGEITTIGRRSYLHSLIEIAGGQNVFGDLDAAYPQIALEEIIARNPDVIIEALPGEIISDTRRKELIGQWQALNTLGAVRNQQIHYLTEDYVLIPSPRVTLLAKRLSGLLTPDPAPAPTSPAGAPLARENTPSAPEATPREP